MKRIKKRPKWLSPYQKQRRPKRPTLRFSPTAWAKLLFLRDYGTTEVGGFGITAADDPLFVTDVRLVGQQCTAVTVAFDDAAVAEFFDEQVDRGLKPAQFARIWIHTHPADWAEPSGIDEETFARVFGSSDWSVMFILARGGATYARLQFSAGPGGALEIPTQVDYGAAFCASDPPSWELEYQLAVMALQARPRISAPVIGVVRELPIQDDDPFPWEEPWYAD